MPKNAAKILAKLIQMYRAGYVRAAQSSIGAQNINQALMNFILGAKKVQPMGMSFTKKNTDAILKTILKGGLVK
uniref:Uncharacterized protein n=1 Tax=viral metagenome TaxID=1070528 RepID=A0A6M3JAN6_9ZZZZ